MVAVAKSLLATTLKVAATALLAYVTAKAVKSTTETGTMSKPKKETPLKDEYVPFHKGNYGFAGFNILTDNLVRSYYYLNKRNSNIYSKEVAERLHEIERGAFEGINKLLKHMYEEKQKKKEV